MENQNKIHAVRRNLFFYRNLSVQIALILPLFILQGCSHNTEKGKESVKSGDLSSGPRLVVDNDTYDFGALIEGDIKKGVFNLFNAGDKTLVVKDIGKCCGTVIEIDKKEILPGQIASLTAEIGSFRGSGLFSKNITIYTNDPVNSIKILTIKGIVNPSIEWSPKEYKVSKLGNSDIPEITIRSLNNKPISVKNFASTNMAFTAAFDPNKQETEITLKPELNLQKIKAIKNSNGIISIQISNPYDAVINVPFQWVRPLEVSPSSIVIMRAKKGEPIETALNIRDNEVSGGENIFKYIESITASNNTKVQILKHDNLVKACKVYLKIIPPKKEILQSESSSHVELIIKMKDGNQLHVPIREYY